MLEAHIKLNTGSFFIERVIEGSRVSAVTSTIKDVYWNFAYSKIDQPFHQEQIVEAAALLASVNRRCRLWQPEYHSVPDGWVVRSRETWMWAAADEWQRDFGGAPRKGVLEIREVENPTVEMQRVFVDAYSSEAQEGDIGYFELPPEYAKAYVNGIVSPLVHERHFAGYIDDVCVAIASIVVADGVAGLYSVATLHGFRMRGFGNEITRTALRWVFNGGAYGDAANRGGLYRRIDV